MDSCIHDFYFDQMKGEMVGSQEFEISESYGKVFTPRLIFIINIECQLVHKVMFQEALESFWPAEVIWMHQLLILSSKYSATGSFMHFENFKVKL